MFLEVLHPLFGYTKGSSIKNLAIIGARNFVIFVLIESEERMHEKPVVFYLMVVYSALEIVRYPYYLLRVYDVEVKYVFTITYISNTSNTYNIYINIYIFEYLVIGWFVKLDSLHDMDPPIPTCVRV